MCTSAIMREQTQLLYTKNIYPLCLGSANNHLILIDIILEMDKLYYLIARKN